MSTEGNVGAGKYGRAGVWEREGRGTGGSRGVWECRREYGSTGVREYGAAIVLRPVCVRREGWREGVWEYGVREYNSTIVLR